jgi:fructan beta-fructosidase
MVTALADQHKIRFDGSPDLKQWTHLSEFGPSGQVDNEWECPDLFPINVEGEKGLQKWILKVDVNYSILGQYFIGHFDGMRFVNDNSSEQILRVDYGRDFYAAQSWSDEPNGRRIWIGWMNNWHYAKAIPTSPWRGLFSIPRELTLRQYPGGLRLIQQPIQELKQLRQLLYQVTDTDIAKVNTKLADLKTDIAQEIKVEFASSTAQEFGIRICTGDAEETVIGYDAQKQELFVDRRHSGDSTFSEEFGGVQRGHLPPDEGKIRMHIFVDSCSLEVFGNDGFTVISDLMFPNSQSARLEVYALAGDVHLNTLEIWKLEAGG